MATRYNASGLQAEFKSGLNQQVLKNHLGRDSEMSKIVTIYQPDPNEWIEFRKRGGHV
ncbi:MAG: hypothetical protein HYU73_05405 [Betaproteobacteria bacterium]|nr:hypothetical protein [Betaproteobacteria bacterium]